MADWAVAEPGAGGTVPLVLPEPGGADKTRAIRVCAVVPPAAGGASSGLGSSDPYKSLVVVVGAPGGGVGTNRLMGTLVGRAYEPRLGAVGTNPDAPGLFAWMPLPPPDETLMVLYG